MFLNACQAVFTSLSSGSAGKAPNRETAKPPHAAANLIKCFNVLGFAMASYGLDKELNPNKRPPLNASPPAVVSIASTLGGLSKYLCSSI